MLGTDRGAQTAVIALAVVDGGQVVFHGDGLFGADLLTQAAADAADGAAAGGDGTLGKRCAGDDHIPVRLHRHNQMPGTYRGTGHTAYAQVFVHMGNAVDDLHGAVLAGLHAAAVAQTAVLTGQGAAAADLGSCQTVLEAFVIGLDLGTLGQVAVGVVNLFTGAAHQGNFPGDGLGLYAHNGSHGLGTVVAAGGALADFRLAVKHGFCVSTAAGIAAAAAVGAGQTLVQLIQPGVALYVEYFGSGSQNQTENQAQAAQNCNRNQNFHSFALLRKCSDRRSP